MSQSPSLQRRLGGFDATTVGIGSIIGAGVFVVFAPAAASAGPWLLLALGIAGLIAYFNASATAQLARLYPTSGGTYVYGRERLGSWAGFIAGWSFITGKVASCAAIALTFGLYAFPGYEIPAAIAAVVLLTSVNLLGITRTAWAARIIVSVVVALLAFVVVVAFDTDPSGAVATAGEISVWGMLQAAGLMFFAFAGYARIATMGEEVREPERNIPRAIFAALAFVLVLYSLLAIGLLRVLGPGGLAESTTPLLDLVQNIGNSVGTAAVTIAAAAATLGALLALVAGVGRTTLAMARKGDLPRPLAAVSQRFRVPFAADLSVAGLVIVLLLSTDVLTMVGFSSFGVLIYYAIANLAAFTLDERPWYWPKALNLAGLAGCLLLAFTLPVMSVLIMCAVLAAGIAGRAFVLFLRNRSAQR